MTKEEIEKVFSYHKWRQKILIKDGIYTPGHIDNNIWFDLGLPDSVEGLNILDIGSNDGQIVFEAERRGAKIIYASDLYINKLETMANGWPIEGISILKEIINSKVIIHKEGLFGLDLIKEHFDIVILNNVLNWIGDIDMVIKQLSKLSLDKLYISDQFLKLNEVPEKKKPSSKDLQVFKELCNVKYIIEKTLEYGFKVDSVKPIDVESNYLRRYIEKFILESKGEIDFYELPDLNSKIIDKSKFKGESINAFNGFFFIRNKGWVKSTDVITEKNKLSLIAVVLKKLGLFNIYKKIKNRLNNKETYNLTIVFNK